MATPDPNDLSPLEKAVNDAAGKVTVLWTSFIMLGTYLVITTGAIKHRDLFLDASIKLPVLGVELPVTGYFLVVSVILVIFHSYVLLQLHGLSKRVLDYNALLIRTVIGAGDRQLIRHRLDIFPFLQFLARGEERHARHFGGLQGAISWLTIVAFPLLVLVQLQIAFLPFHSWVTWLHRACIVVDIFLVWTFWGSLPTIRKRRLPMRMATALASALATLVILIFSLCLATYPGEAVYRNALAKIIDASVSRLARNTSRSASGMLFEGRVDGVTGRPNSLFANRVILTGERFYDQAKHASADVSVSLRGRDLRGAILQRTDLRLADFTGANLVEASFVGAQLQGARFGCASVVEIEASQRLRRRTRAESCDDNLVTDLRGADFSDALLAGASLDHARLQGARLIRSRMSGASLRGTNLTAATMSYARLEGASLTYADLYGVALFQAQLQGADLRGAKLNGAALLMTQLQGTNVGSADLTNTVFTRANLYRAVIKVESHLNTIFNWVIAKPTFPRLPRVVGDQDTDGYVEAASPARLDGKGYAALVQRALDGVQSDETKALITRRLEILDPSVTRKDPEWLVSDRSINSSKDTRARVSRQRVEALAEVMCRVSDAPFVARGFIYNGRILGAGKQGASLVAKLRSRTCPGAAGLEASDFAELRRIGSQLQRQAEREEQENDK